MTVESYAVQLEIVALRCLVIVVPSRGFGAGFTAETRPRGVRSCLFAIEISVPVHLFCPVCPVLLHLPTASGENCACDVFKMGAVLQCKTIDLDWVRVPSRRFGEARDDPDVKIKFHAAEALRELVVWSLTYTETVLPTSWEGETT